MKPFKTIDEQYSILSTRKLKIKDRNFFVDYINKNNYFNVMNGNENLLIPDRTSSKVYKTETFDDFVRLHQFDKEFSGEVLNILHNFETRLRTSISKHFSSIYCNKIEDTMQYTNKDKYKNLKATYATTENYMLFHQQNGKVVKTFDEFDLFDKDFLNKLVSKHDFINEKVFRIDPKIMKYTPPKNCNRYKKDVNVVVPIWVAIETLSFGTLKFMCHYLPKVVIDRVLNDFNLIPNDRDMFLNTLDVINELRNKCAHFTLINLFLTSDRVGILPILIRKLELKPINKERKKARIKSGRYIKINASVLNLFDTLKVLALYEDISSLKKPLKKVIYQNNRYFKKDTYDLNYRLLERMGNSEYKQWKELFTKSKSN